MFLLSSICFPMYVSRFLSLSLFLFLSFFAFSLFLLCLLAFIYLFFCYIGDLYVCNQKNCLNHNSIPYQIYTCLKPTGGAHPTSFSCKCVWCVCVTFYLSFSCLALIYTAKLDAYTTPSHLIVFPIRPYRSCRSVACFVGGREQTIDVVSQCVCVCASPSVRFSRIK